MTSLGLVFIITLGCASIGGSYWDQHYGKAHPLELVDSPLQAPLTYYGDTQSIIEKRCVVCHGCYDAPCQLKLEAYEGLLRGANPSKVYDSSRLLGASLTRLFEDAETTAQWREKGFHPVLNERRDNAYANINAGVMAQLLELKQTHPLPDVTVLPESFNFDINQQPFCPSIETFDHFAKKQPLWGMPYGLPALNDSEHQTMMNWLKDGAPVGKNKALSAEVLQQLNQWETFFNGSSLKQQLVNRYIYEHLFLASLFFADAQGIHFRLVRSSTPPGEPIERIPSARPFDDPMVSRVYYRLWRDPSSVIAKTYMPYALTPARMNELQALFYATDAANTYESIVRYL